MMKSYLVFLQFYLTCKKTEKFYLLTISNKFCLPCEIYAITLMANKNKTITKYFNYILQNSLFQNSHLTITSPVLSIFTLTGLLQK